MYFLFHKPPKVLNHLTHTIMQVLRQAHDITPEALLATDEGKVVHDYLVNVISVCNYQHTSFSLEPDSDSANTNIQFFEEDFAKRATDPNAHWKYKAPKMPWTDRYQKMCNHEEKMVCLCPNDLMIV